MYSAGTKGLIRGMKRGMTMEVKVAVIRKTKAGSSGTPGTAREIDRARISARKTKRIDESADKSPCDGSTEKSAEADVLPGRFERRKAVDKKVQPP